MRETGFEDVGLGGESDIEVDHQRLEIKVLSDTSAYWSKWFKLIKCLGVDGWVEMTVLYQFKYPDSAYKAFSKSYSRSVHSSHSARGLQASSDQDLHTPSLTQNQNQNHHLFLGYHHSRWLTFQTTRLEKTRDIWTCAARNHKTRKPNQYFSSITLSIVCVLRLHSIQPIANFWKTNLSHNISLF